MKLIYIAFSMFAAVAALASTQSPYAGEESNRIKGLSPEEVRGLLEGHGMGFAKVAELNQYPGPRHVLDLAEQLHLTQQQLDETNRIFEKMHGKAVSLGMQLVEYEMELDALFASNEITASDLDSLMLKIGEVRARLRGVHLHAHLEMTEILSPHQIAMYDNLRGYSGGNDKHQHSH